MKYDDRLPELKRLMESEQTVKDIAQIMRITRPNVSKLIKRHGLKFDRQKKKAALVAKVKELAKIKSQAAIARELKLSQSTICKLVNHDETRVDTRAYKPKLLKKEPPMNFAAQDLTKQLEAAYRG